MEKNGTKNNRSFWQRLIPLGLRKTVTQEEIETLIDSGQETGLIDEEKNEMIHRIFELKEIVVREVMIPRTDIKALEVNSTMEEVAGLVVEVGHSRVPVYEETIDKIIGIIYAKDLLKYWVSKGKNITVRELMRKPLFIPETKGIDELFTELKSKRIHIAIVVDEYGGTSGLVTIEDLIEEIVGDIQDEYDVEEEEFVETGVGEYLVDARMDIDELAEKLDVELPKEDFDTLGGFLVHLTNRIPATGESINFSRLRFTIIEADERKVAKVKIQIEPDSAKESVSDPA